MERALGYLRAGYPINLAGPAGTGKTTLALHLAARLRQPVTLIHGDDEFGSSDLVGNDHGYRKSKLIDNFIHSVVKTEETMKTLWTDNRLTTACRFGHVLIYDEFTRSRPEANNVLLSVLGERLLNLPKKCNGGEGYLEVHPAFRAIFTSNPQEYAGVHKSQDALLGPAHHHLHGPLRPRHGSGDYRFQRRRLDGDGGADHRSRALLPQAGSQRATSEHPGGHHDRQGPGLPGADLRPGQSGGLEHLPGRPARRQSLRQGQESRSAGGVAADAPSDLGSFPGLRVRSLDGGPVVRRSRRGARMKSKLRKGLQDIRTRSSLTGDAENPQRKFLRVASLELKKSLCSKVRDAARKRSEEMDKKIAELDGEKAKLLASSQVSAEGVTDPAAAQPSAIGDGIARAERLCVEVLRCRHEAAHEKGIP